MAKTWNQLIGHSAIRGWFAQSLAAKRLGGSLLFVGPAGVGKRTFASLLAKTLLCSRSVPAEMAPCGVCESCQQVEANTHPDLIIVRKPDDKSTIPLDLLIGRPEARMQEGFCRDVRLKPYMGRRKVAIVEDADYLNEEGANCLLKTLEEPPPDAVMILIGTSEQRQLPTIRSRCQTIRFSLPQADDARRLIREVHQIDADDSKIDDAVELAAGDIHVAVSLLSGDNESLYQSLQDRLSGSHPDPIGLSRIITEFVEAAGKDATKRRDAMRSIFSIAVQYFRGELRRQASANWVSDSTIARLDRSVRALREVDRSANQATLIECFAADIATATTGDRGEIG